MKVGRSMFIHRVSDTTEPLLFHHIFALTATNCMKFFREVHKRCCLL